MWASGSVAVELDIEEEVRVVEGGGELDEGQRGGLWQAPACASKFASTSIAQNSRRPNEWKAEASSRHHQCDEVHEHER